MSTTVMVIGEQVAGESVKARKQLEGLISHYNKSTFEIGRLLHRVKKNAWLPEGFTTFQDYQATLDIKPRKAQYLRRIAEVMEEINVPAEKYESIGTAKLREITSLNLEETWTNPQTGEQTPMKEFVTGFVEKADSLTLDEVKQHVRTLKGLVGENDIVWENFCVTRSTRENIINPAKERARQMIGSVGTDDEGMAKDISDGACLEAWAAAYLSDPNNQLEEQK